MTEKDETPQPEPTEPSKKFKPRPRMLQRGFGHRKCCGGK